MRFVRQALTGEKVTEEYETFSIRGFRLARPPAAVPKVLVAALRPQMLALGASEADGVILNWLSSDDVKQVVPIVREKNADAEVVARIMVAPTTDAEAVRATLRPVITGYLNVPGYRAYMQWLGRGDALQPMWDAWDAGDRKAALAAVPDSVVDELCVHGSPDDCRAQLERFVEHGVTTPVIAVMPVGIDEREAAASLAPRR